MVWRKTRLLGGAHSGQVAGAVADTEEYDGSIIVERTKGTMGARCDKEEMNFLALNLAHEIITGNKDVKAARDAYAQTVKQVMAGEKPELTTKLAFSRSRRRATRTWR